MGRILLSLALMVAWSLAVEASPNSGWSLSIVCVALPATDESRTGQVSLGNSSSLEIAAGASVPDATAAGRQPQQDLPRWCTSLRQLAVLWQV